MKIHTKYVYFPQKPSLQSQRIRMNLRVKLSLVTVGLIILFRSKDILVEHLEIQLFMEEKW